MSKSKLKSFAHMLGLGARAEDEEPKTPPAEDHDEDELEGEEDRLEGESDEDYEKRTGKKAKKAKKAEDDDGDGIEMSEESDDEGEKEKAARVSERARCSAIIATGIKLGCVEQAGVFAFDTSMSASAAISALKAGMAARGTKPGLGNRMKAEPMPRVGADAGASGPDLSTPAGQAAAIIAAGKKARGEA